MSRFHAQPSRLSDGINHSLFVLFTHPTFHCPPLLPSPFLSTSSPFFSPSLLILLSWFLLPVPHVIQRVPGQRKERSSVPRRGVMGQATWPVFTPTTAAFQAVRTRTGSPQRVSYFIYLFISAWKDRKEKKRDASPRMSFSGFWFRSTLYISSQPKVLIEINCNINLKKHIYIDSVVHMLS